MEIDLGYDGGSSNNEPVEPIEPINGGQQFDENGNPITNVNEPVPPTDPKDPKDPKDPNDPNDPNNPNDRNDPKDPKDNEVELKEGYTLTVEDKTYTVDKDGNLVDEQGNVFKKAEEVKDWLKEFSVEDDDNTEIDLAKIQEALDYEVTDEDGNAIEYEHNIEGIKAYINDVIETSKLEHYETAVNTLYQKYPMLKEVLDYYVANGNSLEGFTETPDRSNIQIDDNNEEQQIEIIKTLWKEQGIKGDVQQYINYLKNASILTSTAKDALKTLQEMDKENKKAFEAEAERRQQEDYEREVQHWTNIKNIIDSKEIAGYKIPDNITISRNGQKVSVTPNDFFNYLYRVDNENKSMYQRDLEAEDPKDSLNDAILRAYLKFTGGSYADLVNMAINQEKVNKLKLKAKQTGSKSIKVTKPVNTKPNGNIDLGYN